MKLPRKSTVKKYTLHVITEESFLIEDEQNYMTILWQPSTHDNWKNISPTSSKKNFSPAID